MYAFLTFYIYSSKYKVVQTQHRTVGAYFGRNSRMFFFRIKCISANQSYGLLGINDYVRLYDMYFSFHIAKCSYS